VSDRSTTSYKKQCKLYTLFGCAKDGLEKEVKNREENGIWLCRDVMKFGWDYTESFPSAFDQKCEKR